MKKTIALIFVMCCLLLVSCGNPGGGESAFVAKSSDNIEKTYDVEKYFKENYVDDKKLPILDIHIENPFIDGDRILILDDSIENNIELMIYEYYRNLMSGKYQETKAVIEDGSLFAATEADENNFKEGIYYSKIFLDEVDLVDKDDLDGISGKNKQDIVQRLVDLRATEFAIVEVEKTIKHNQKSLSLVPQVGDGEVTRYFVVGKIDGVYKLVEVYWEGFLAD